jgi:hypothetical protein
MQAPVVIPPDDENTEVVDETPEEEYIPDEPDDNGSSWLYFIIIFVIIGLIVGALYFLQGKQIRFRGKTFTFPVFKKWTEPRKANFVNLQNGSSPQVQHLGQNYNQNMYQKQNAPQVKPIAEKNVPQSPPRMFSDSKERRSEMMKKFD